MPPPPGMMPSVISGWPNWAAVGGDDHVAGERQLAAATEGEAGHGGDQRARQPATPFQNTEVG